MPKASAKKRIETYDIKRKGSMIQAYKDMVSRPTIDLAALGDRAKFDEMIAGILNKHDITGNDRIKYYNFARRIEKLKRTMNLTPTAIEAEKARFTRLGCDATVLDEIVKTITGAE
jgi:hypothetical protein